eukprot:jgi/Tetstr1/431677/TSEL_021205.t1
MAADPGTLARYVTWLGNLGAIKASILQPYLSAVNNFFKDHGREPMALGDLVSRVRKGLAASQVTLNPELMRSPLPARVLLKALTLAQALRLELFRASLAVVVLCLFSCRGGAGVECRTGDLTGATTTAYVIGVTMQKLKYFGGWAMESSVVLDYMDPTVLPRRAPWHLFG